MSGTDSPNTGSGNDTALSFDDGVAAIEGFLSSVPDSLEEGDKDSATVNESQTASDQDEGAEASTEANGENAEGDDDPDLELELDASDEGKPAPDEPAFKNGQFASRDAKVKLDDGTTISVADLIAGNMFQRKFTEKTTALSEEKKNFDKERGDFADTKKQVEQQRQALLTLASELLPKEPQPVNPDEDPHGYISYLAEKEAYQSKVNRLQELWQASQGDQAKQTEQQKKEAEEAEKAALADLELWKSGEREKLFNAIPKLKEKANREKWQAETSKIARDVYGLDDEELSSVFDHRYLMILSDAAAFRRALAKQKAGDKPAPVQNQQPRIPQKQRMAPQAPQARDFTAATDRLRKTGSLQDAAKALEKFV